MGLRVLSLHLQIYASCESVKLTVALPHHQRFRSRALMPVHCYSFLCLASRLRVYAQSAKLMV